MTDQERNSFVCALSALGVFREILTEKPIAALLDFLRCDTDVQKQSELFGRFVYSLKEDHYCFSDFLCRVICKSENAYVVNLAQNTEIPDVLRENTMAELRLFTDLSKITFDRLRSSLDYCGYLPRFDNRETDFEKLYNERCRYVHRLGFGLFSTATVFRFANREILPVSAFDKITEDTFIGYENQRKQVFDNTLALIEGKPAANVLLFGDAGTGKSSTVKACANRFSKDGLRLIELRKDQLLDLPCVMEKISGNPLKFIIFIDDLSFVRNDDTFGMLKATLEGSVSSKAQNSVIYVTSNRRHIIKETFSDRTDADDLHLNDTVQELKSLSDRFGRTVYFEKPDKSLYLYIVHELAARNGIAVDLEMLDREAEAFALKKGGRSPRAAEQFINGLLSNDL